MLNTINTTVLILSGFPLAPLNFVHNFSLSCTNKNPFKTNTNLNITANLCQKLYQAFSATILGPSATFSSSSCTVKPRSPSLVITQNFTVTFVAMN